MDRRKKHLQILLILVQGSCQQSPSSQSAVFSCLIRVQCGRWVFIAAVTGGMCAIDYLMDCGCSEK